MSGDLLQTKLYVPRLRPSYVPRPHLIEKLNQGWQQGSKLTLVSAPAGFGKTTLITDWGMQFAESTNPNSTLRTPHLCWLSLDESDNDLNRFLTYVVAALQTIDSNIGKVVMAALQAPGAVNVEIILTSLLNEIAEFPDDVVLILDDYHVIESQPIDRAITSLLDHLPPQLHLVIISRIDPTLPLSRLRARGQMIEIRADDLRFTSDEAAAFLNQMTDFDLSAEEIAALEVHTEGWIGGLQLATISMQKLNGHGEIVDFINNFSGNNRYIQDYLADEALQRQPQEIKDFLLQTSILNRLCAPLCDAVYVNAANNSPDSQTILERLETTNLFIVPLDNERRWYRYHHLFADLLRTRLQRTQSALVSALHHRASGWYEHNGDMSAAIEHALAAQDWERAALLVETAAWPAIQQGEYSALRQWLESLPEDVLYARPQLCLMYAWGLVFVGEIEAYKRPLTAAKQIWKKEGNDAKLGEVFNLRADIALSRNQLETGVKLARQALELLDKEDDYNRNLSWMYLGSAYYPMGEIKLARQALEKSRAMSQISDNRYAYTAASNTLGMVLTAQGQLEQAADLYRQIMQLSGDAVLHGGLVAQILYSHILLEWYDLDAADHQLRHALELLEKTGLEIYAGVGYAFMALLLYARGKTEQVHDFIDRAIDIECQLGDPFRERQARAIKAKLSLMQGDGTAVTHWLQTNGITLDDEADDYRRETEYFTLAQVSIAEGRDGAAKTFPLLSRLLAKATAQERVDSELRVWIISAMAHQAVGNKTAALHALECALTMANPGRYVRVFVSEGEPMATLLRQAARQGIMFSDNLLPALRNSRPNAQSPLPETLTQREIQVLTLISVGATNREIAQELVIALSTVKVHIKHIYNKLNVANRTQAAVRARELNIL